MAFSNDNKPSGSYSSDSKPSSFATSIDIGTPIGLLLSLTYAEAVSSGGGYSFDTKNSATSYSLDSKP